MHRRQRRAENREGVDFVCKCSRVLPCSASMLAARLTVVIRTILRTEIPYSIEAVREAGQCCWDRSVDLMVQAQCWQRHDQKAKVGITICTDARPAHIAHHNDERRGAKDVGRHNNVSREYDVGPQDQQGAVICRVLDRFPTETKSRIKACHGRRMGDASKLYPCFWVKESHGLVDGGGWCH